VAWLHIVDLPLESDGVAPVDTHQLVIRGQRSLDMSCIELGFVDYTAMEGVAKLEPSRGTPGPSRRLSNSLDLIRALTTPGP